MARKFSEETRRKIAEKAREREARKRAEREKSRGGAIVVCDPNTPPPSGEEAGFSARTKKAMKDLLEVRIRAEASIEDLKVKAKTLKEGADIAVEQRDTLLRTGLDENSLDSKFEQIRDITGRRDAALGRLKKTKNKIRAQKAIVAEALVKMDRVIMGESAEGTIFEGTARK